MTYDVLWADDDWATGGEPVDAERAKRRGRLEAIQTAITTRLVAVGVDVEWVTDTVVSDSVTRLHESDADFRLAIVDLDFGASQWRWQNLYRALDQLHIPFVFYTAFPEKLAPYAEHLEDNVRCVGIFEKQRQDAAFVDRVTAFCVAPPFNLVHVSDIHFDVTASRSARDEQEALLGSLVETLGQLNRKRPIDLVAFTGDFAHCHPASELKEVRPFITDLIEATVTHARARRCFAVPGNHDMLWDSYHDGQLARQPWADFADFCCAVFANNPQSRSELKGWSEARQLLLTQSDGLGLCWARKLKDPPVSVVGLVSTTDQAAQRGTGDFRGTHIDILKSAWTDPPMPGEVRICLMHHNLLAPVSFSRFDEKTTVHDAGAAMLALLQTGCHVVLSGHVHTSQNIRFEAAIGDPERLASMLIIGTGPTGGTHAAKDRPRAFSCLEFGDAVSGTRNVSVTRFEYDGRYRHWKEGPPFLFAARGSRPLPLVKA